MPEYLFRWNNCATTTANHEEKDLVIDELNQLNGIRRAYPLELLRESSSYQFLLIFLSPRISEKCIFEENLRLSSISYSSYRYVGPMEKLKGWKEVWSKLRLCRFIIVLIYFADIICRYFDSTLDRKSIEGKKEKHERKKTISLLRVELETLKAR